MSDRVGVLIACAVLALAAAVAFDEVRSGNNNQEGRFRLVVSGGGLLVRMDIATGETWWSAGGQTPWKRVEDPIREYSVEDIYGEPKKHEGEAKR